MKRFNKKDNKAVINFMEAVEKEAPIIIPSGEYVFKWSLKTYQQIFNRFVIKGNTITGSNEGIRT